MSASREEITASNVATSLGASPVMQAEDRFSLLRLQPQSDLYSVCLHSTLALVRFGGRLSSYQAVGPASGVGNSSATLLTSTVTSTLLGTCNNVVDTAPLADSTRSSRCKEVDAGILSLQFAPTSRYGFTGLRSLVSRTPMPPMRCFNLGAQQHESTPNVQQERCYGLPSSRFRTANNRVDCSRSTGCWGRDQWSTCHNVSDLGCRSAPIGARHIELPRKSQNSFQHHGF